MQEYWHTPRLIERETGEPGTFTKADAGAFRSLWAYALGGEYPPDAHQVRRALNWIINNACETHGDPFVTGHPDAVSYRLGRRSIGLAIIKLISAPPERFFPVADGIGGPPPATTDEAGAQSPQS